MNEGKRESEKEKSNGKSQSVIYFLTDRRMHGHTQSNVASIKKIYINGFNEINKDDYIEIHNNRFIIIEI